MITITTRSAVLAAILIAIGVGTGVDAAEPARMGTPPSAADVDAAVQAAFARAPAEWQPRLKGDATMQTCSATGNTPPSAVFRAIGASERALVKYPDDGQVLGDWKKGEVLAQSGYGLRFTDYPARNPNGGNCYACHQLSKTELSYGTIGPSLLGYGKTRKFLPIAAKFAYEKIYNSHATYPCSLMPRFGTNGILTIDQIKDLTALLMAPESPVNE